jgi:hypothetical protein
MNLAMLQTVLGKSVLGLHGTVPVITHVDTHKLEPLQEDMALA